MDDKQALATVSYSSAAIFAKVQNWPGGAQQNQSGGERLLHLDSGFSTSRDHPCQRVKFMCSHGGEILPRPSDRKLRYVGGETRMFSVPRHIHYAGFLNKLTEIYGQDLTLKYQLPDEDLDALVSVCSDEDLENMMEECSRVDSCKGSSRLRVFVFPLSELDAANLSDIGDTEILEQRYVDAVNDVPPEASFEASFRRQIDHAPADSSINLEGDDACARIAARVQEKSDFLSENPQSEVLFSGNFVPNTGTTLLSKTLQSEHVVAATFPPHTPSHSTFTTQPRVLESAPEVALDKLANISGSRGATSDVDTFLDPECGSSASSSASSHYELHHRLPDSRRVPSPPMQALKELTLHRNDEDRAYRVEQRCIAEIRGQKGESHGRMHVKVSKERLLSGEPPDLQDERCGLASAYDNERSDNQLHRDLPWPTTTVQQKQLQADWHQVEIPCDDKLIVMNSLQKPPQNSGFGQQQAFTVEQQQQQPQQNMLFCNPLATLDQKSAVLDHMEELSPEDSLSAQMLFLAEAHPVPQKTSTSVHHTGCSAPSSPTRGKMTGTGKPGAFPLQGQIHQTPMRDFLDQEFPNMLSDYDGACNNKASWCASKHPLWSFLNPENTLHEELMDPYHLGRTLVDAAGLHLNGQPVLALSSAMPKQQVGSPTFQNHEDFKDAEAFSLQPPCLSFLEESLPTVSLAAINIYAAVQSESEQFHTLGPMPLNLPVASPHSAVGGDMPTLGRAMVLDSLQSSRLSNCLPAEIYVADMSTSMSPGCPLKPCQEGDDFMPREKTEPTVGTIGIIEPSMSMQINSENKSFASAQDSMFSVEQFNLMRCQENAKIWLSAFDEDTDLDDKKSLEIFGENLPTAVNPAPFLAVSLSPAPWETSLSQAEHVHCAVMENFSKEKGLDGLDLHLAMENEVTYEDLNLEIEELDRFDSSADQTSHAAVDAENEAISRGLQTVRNFDLEELRELGSGTFGTVYHGKWRGTDVAIKRIKSSCFTGRQSERERLMADFWREAYILGQLHHPNVVAFYGVVPDGPGGTLATVTEYMVNGSLKQVLQKKDRTLDRRKRLLIAMDAAFGMEYLHGKNVVHFDIKCENLLVNLRDTQRPICKVGDLGLSKVKQQTMVSGGVRGTLPWMAPELLNGSSSLVSEKVDVFSFGIVLWELLTGEEPYANMHYGAIIGGIVNNTLRPPIPKWCDPAWRSVMEKCWSADPADRPTFTEIARSLRMMEASLNAKGQGQALTAGRYS